MKSGLLGNDMCCCMLIGSSSRTLIGHGIYMPVLVKSSGRTNKLIPPPVPRYANLVPMKEKSCSLRLNSGLGWAQELGNSNYVQNRIL